jgi:hypothetical protein
MNLTEKRLRNKVKKLEDILIKINKECNINFAAPDLIIYKVKLINKWSAEAIKKT